MLLTVTTTHEPATDLGHLLAKHPDRVQRFDLPTGSAYVCYPEATARRCTAALILEVDPARLSSHRPPGQRTTPESFTLGHFVNDRPYAASSLLAGAMAKVFRSALHGESRDRPELAATPIPLRLRIPALRCRGGAALAHRLFEPLGWSVEAVPIALDEHHEDWGESHYVDLTLTGTARLGDALNQIYVLLPVLDDAKHYWVAPDEVEKLLRAGVGWLAGHPERGLIAHRYLARRRHLADQALERLAALDRLGDEGTEPAGAGPESTSEEADLPAEVKRLPLAQRRRQAVHAALARTGATRVLDLGCGAGALLAELIRQPRYTEIVGVDVSTQALAQAHRRLRLDRLPERQHGRIKLWHSALTYLDDRLVGFDAAVLMEVIEHLDPPRLPALAATVFGHARPGAVVVTTPNVEYNVRYEGMAPGSLRHHNHQWLRHPDHRFEWSRAEFAAWSARVGEIYGYSVSLHPVGDEDPDVGAPTQLAVFTRSAP